MKILALIKELSEQYKITIRLVSEPFEDGTIKLYINYGQVNYITINNTMTDDYICDCIKECVERYFKR